MPVMARLARIAPGLLLATSRLYQTTSSVLIGERGTALLIDPAWEPDELAELGRDLLRRRLRVEAGLATHFHHDHLLWHPGFGDVARWASKTTVSVVKAKRQELLAELGSSWPQELASVFGRVSALTESFVPWSGPEVQLVLHDAHAPGHVAAWVPARRALIAGDMLSDVELPLPVDDPGLAGYAQGLEILAPFVGLAELLVPGHGTPTRSPWQRLDADRRYIDAVLARRHPDDPRMGNPGMAEAHRATVRMAHEG
jgi:glyoxylase-like metal-dependent hydrolase (beta-lactamase superfamily II)